MIFIIIITLDGLLSPKAQAPFLVTTLFEGSLGLFPSLVAGPGLVAGEGLVMGAGLVAGATLVTVATL
eukprot:10937658-Karenia_brevis.AAC.1